MRSKALVLLLLLPVSTCFCQSRIVAMKCGTLNDERSDAPMENAVILVLGRAITQVGTGLIIPAEASVIDLSGATVAAALLDQSGKIEEIAPGAFADIVAVKAIPLQDITILKHIGFVVKDGKVVKDEMKR